MLGTKSTRGLQVMYKKFNQGEQNKIQQQNQNNLAMIKKWICVSKRSVCLCRETLQYAKLKSDINK